MKTNLMTWFLVPLAVFALWGEEKVWQFDFGTKDSLVMEGFTGVNPTSLYEEGKGFGFTVSEGVNAVDRKMPDPLGRDFVICSEKSVFRANVPNGNYKVWLMYGDSHAQVVVYPVMGAMEVKVNGQQVWQKKAQTMAEFYQVLFRNWDKDYRRGDDIWNKYLAPKFQTFSFPVAVTQGCLEFVLKGIPVNAMMIYPEEQAGEFEADIDYLNKRRRRKVNITEIKSNVAVKVPNLNKADQKRGYGLFVRQWGERIFPSTVPSNEELGRELGIFACAGEKQVGAFGIYPITDLKDVSLQTGDLIGPGGEKIPSGAIELRMVRYLEVSAGGGTAEYQYQVKPAILQSRAKMDVETGVTRQVMVKVRVPVGTKPGTYQGKVIVNCPGRPSGVVVIQVRVLPFELAESSLIYGLYHMSFEFYYYHYWQKRFTGETEAIERLVWEHEEKTFQLLKDAGINALAMNDDFRGEVTSSDGKTIQINFGGRFGKLMKLYSTVGFKVMPWYGFQTYLPRRDSSSAKWRSTLLDFVKLETVPFTPEWDQAYTQLVTLVRDEAKRCQWPEIMFYLSDELSNHGHVDEAVKSLDLLRKIPEIRYLSSCNGPAERALVPNHQIIMPNFAFPITEESIKFIESNQAELWLYNCSSSRFSFGFYPWRVGAKGRFQWTNRTTDCAAYDDFDGGRRDALYSFTYATPDGGVLGTPMLEEMAAGINDMRYLVTLEHFIEKNAKSTDMKMTKEIERARNLLSEIRNEISCDFRDHMPVSMDAKDVGGDAMRKWTNEFCDRYRWRIAEQIIKLNSID